MFRYLAVPTFLAAFVLALPVRLHADEAEGVVELVPDNPGPYVGGETVQIDVWIHSLVSFHAQFDWIQFDFRDTSAQIVLPEQVTFDYSTLDQPHGFEEGRLLPEFSFGPPYLPAPLTVNGWAIACYPCGDVFFVIPPQGSFHIGNFSLQLPTEPGSYRLDVMNADEPDPDYGAMLSLNYGPTWPDNWNASTGELVGGVRTLVVAGPIPAISGLWIAILTAALVCAGAILMRKRQWALQVLAATLSTCLVPAGADGSAEVLSEVVQVSLDSGNVSASGSGTEPVVVYSEMLSLPDRTWIRLHFSVVQLSGASGSESFVRLTSDLDGGSQIMRAADFAAWSDSSAVFNGDAVLVEILSFLGTGSNRLVADLALVSATGTLSEEGFVGVCGADDRVLSHDPRIGRIWYSSNGPCQGHGRQSTGYFFENRGSAMITAAHSCAEWVFPPLCEFPPIVEFNVDEFGNHPPPEHQYAVDRDSVLVGFAGHGDWCIYGLHPNEFGNALHAQGSSLRLARVVPANSGETLRVTGFGRIYPGTQQTTATGARVPLAAGDESYRIRYLADMAPGASGCPVQQICGLSFGINALAHCGTVIGANGGQRIDFSHTVDAMTPNCVDDGIFEPLGSAADCNDNGIEDWCDVGCYYLHGNCAEPCGGFADCNHNLTPDECEPDTDWNNNQIQDICDIAAATAPDCNFNFVIDGKDIEDGFSEDENEDGVPDECVPVYDCNDNDREDICDIAIQASTDVNANAIPDECETWRLGACCGAEGCEYLLELECLLEGGQFAGGPCLPLTCNAYGPMP